MEIPASLSVDFAKVHINRSSKKKILLRNDGVLPATCLIDIIGHSDFVLPVKGSSITVNPASKEELEVFFSPVAVTDGAERTAAVKITVLNNMYDSYTVGLSGVTYACDATIDYYDSSTDPTAEVDQNEDGYKDCDEGGRGGQTDGQMGPKYSKIEKRAPEDIIFRPLNLADGPKRTSHSIVVKSRSEFPLKFNMSLQDESVKNSISFSPSTGHLSAGGSKEVQIIFSASEPINIENIPVLCQLRRIKYAPNPKYAIPENFDGGADGANETVTRLSEAQSAETALYGLWTDCLTVRRQLVSTSYIVSVETPVIDPSTKPILHSTKPTLIVLFRLNVLQLNPTWRL